MKRVIWYLHHYAGGPGIGTLGRPYYLAKELQAFNCETYVVAASYHHHLQRENRMTEPMQKEVIATIPYIWVKTPRYQGNGLKRILNLFVYAYQIRRHSKRLLELASKPDVIIVSSGHPFHYFAARKLAKRFKAKLIFEVRDLWPQSWIEILKFSQFHPLVQWLAWIEKKAYKEADYVVSVLPNALAYMQTKGLTPQRYVHIANGISSDNIEQYLQDEETDTHFAMLQPLKAQHKFLIGYAGAHGVPNALDQLIDALHYLQLQGNSRIHAVLVGKGSEKQRLQQQAHGLNNVTFIDSVPKTAIATFLAQMDALFIGWQDLPIYSYGISANKIFEYMLAGKPILQAVNTRYDPVQAAKCGVIVPPAAPKQLAEAMQALAKITDAELLLMGQRGRDYVLMQHDYRILARKYAELFYLPNDI